jgi:hypothetical protein
VTAWATVEQLQTLARQLGVEVPANDNADELLARAQGDCEVWGLRYRLSDLTGLTGEQTAALGEAVCRQACWLLEDEGTYLGPDNVAAIEPGISFSRDPRPRLSPAALEALAHWDLIGRTGTASPDPAPERPPIPWWWWL